jgi:23S rRNA (uracil1939-C5)-methyltransferase
VRVRVSGSRSGVLHGSVMAVLTASPDRLEPACALTQRCGGCPLMSLKLDAQHQLKSKRIARAIDGLAPEPLAITLEAHGPALAYRRRARLAFRKLGSGLVLGYHAHAQSQVVDVRTCPVLTPRATARATRRGSRQTARRSCLRRTASRRSTLP